METDERWYFTKEQLADTPSRKCGIDADKELSNRQRAANFIRDLGQSLNVMQLCINTAIVYMHRFYMCRSFTKFNKYSIATAALFLAAKTEDQPRPLKHVIANAHKCLYKIAPTRQQCLAQEDEVLYNEYMLLATLGFDVAIDHPHAHVVKHCVLLKASAAVAEAAYTMASNSLHMTTMCLQYKPTVVACFCIHLASKEFNWQIPLSNEGQHWFWYVERSLTYDELQQLSSEFLHIFDNYSSRAKRGKSGTTNQCLSLDYPGLSNSPFNYEQHQLNSRADTNSTFQAHPSPMEEPKKPLEQTSSSLSASSRLPVDHRESREEKVHAKVADVTKATGTSFVVLHNERVNYESHSHHKKQQAAPSSTTLSKHPNGPGTKPPYNHHGSHKNNRKAQHASQRRSSFISPSSQSVRPQLLPRDCDTLPTSGKVPYRHNHQGKENTTLVQSSVELAGISDISISDPLMFDRKHGFQQSSVAGQRSEDSFRAENRLEAEYAKSANRDYDPCLKIPNHSVKDTQAKIYAKDQQVQLHQQQHGRKIVHSIEQRNKDILQLVEKPLSPPKTSFRTVTTSVQDEFPANMLKQPHTTKHRHWEKMFSTTTPSGGFSKNSGDFGGTSKIGTIDKNSAHQIVKCDDKTVKNGNAVINENIETEKRPRDQLDDNRVQGMIINKQQQQSSYIQHGISSQTVKRHKSLFSPEITTDSGESHNQMSCPSKQKTPQSTGILTNFSCEGISKSPKVNKLSSYQTDYDHSQIKSLVGQTNLDHQNVLYHYPQVRNLQETSDRQSIKSGTNVEQGMKKIETESGLQIEHDEKRHISGMLKMQGGVPEWVLPNWYNSTSTNRQVGAHSTTNPVSNNLGLFDTPLPLETRLVPRQMHRTNRRDVKNTDEEFQIQSEDSGLSSTLTCESTHGDFSPVELKFSTNTRHQEALTSRPLISPEMSDYHSQKTLSQMQDVQYHGGRFYQYEDGLYSSLSDNRQQYSVGSYSQPSKSIEITESMKKDALSTANISALGVMQQKIPEMNRFALSQQTVNPSQNISSHLMNGYGIMITREEGIKIQSQDSGVSSILTGSSSQSYLPEMKLTQSISAPLQKPISLMPPEIGDHYSQQTWSKAQNNQWHDGCSYRYGDSLNSSFWDNRQQNTVGGYSQSSQSMESTKNVEKYVLSMVNISSLVVQQQKIPKMNPLASSQQTANSFQNPQNIVQTISSSMNYTIDPCLSVPTSTRVTGTTATTMSQGYLTQNISAPLQEPFNAMPPFLPEIGDYYSQQKWPQVQDTPDYGGCSHQYGDSLNSSSLDNRQQNSIGDYSQSSQLMGNNQNIEKYGLSNVNISGLGMEQQKIPKTNPLASFQETPNSSKIAQNIVQTIPSSMNDTTVSRLSASTSTCATGTMATTTMSTKERQSEHHKSYKNKKNKKCKHKESKKDKCRKKKYVHKDKNKEKPIKITIPKNKYNLTNEVNTTTTTHLQINRPQATSVNIPQAELKVEIPKIRLKVVETTSKTLGQAPLTVKIQPSGGSSFDGGCLIRNHEAYNRLHDSEIDGRISTSSSRKRENTSIEASGDGSLAAPPTKKQHLHYPQEGTTTAWQIVGKTTGTR